MTDVIAQLAAAGWSVSVANAMPDEEFEILFIRRGDAVSYVRSDDLESIVAFVSQLVETDNLHLDDVTGEWIVMPPPPETP